MLESPSQPLVPTLCVGTATRTLRVPEPGESECADVCCDAAFDSTKGRRASKMCVPTQSVGTRAAWMVPAIWLMLASVASAGSIGQTINATQPRIVKVYGAGGFRGLEAYQSGMLISTEGHILTARSTVLETDYIRVTLDDGRRFDAKLIGADPRLDVAVLKIDATGLPFFDLQRSIEIVPGTRVLAFSNVFGVAAGDEAASVQHGVVSVETTLQARRGVFQSPYRGPVYVLDAMTNNPGAAGGALVTRRGNLIGMLGKELRNSRNNTWLNYAMPIAELRVSVDEIRAGKFVASQADELGPKPQRPLELRMLGVVLVPDVLERTPPYIDQLRAGSVAAEAGIRPDDLIVMINDRLADSCKFVRNELEYVDFEDEVKLTILRGAELLEIALQARFEGNGG